METETPGTLERFGLKATDLRTLAYAAPKCEQCANEVPALSNGRIMPYCHDDIKSQSTMAPKVRQTHSWLGCQPSTTKAGWYYHTGIRPTLTPVAERNLAIASLVCSRSLA